MEIGFKQGLLSNMTLLDTNIKTGDFCLAFIDNNYSSATLYFKNENKFVPIMPKPEKKGQVLCSQGADKASIYSSEIQLGNKENSSSGKITLFDKNTNSTSIELDSIGNKQNPFGAIFVNKICVTSNGSYPSDFPTNAIEGQIYFKLLD